MPNDDFNTVNSTSSTQTLYNIGGAELTEGELTSALSAGADSFAETYGFSHIEMDYISTLDGNGNNLSRADIEAAIGQYGSTTTSTETNTDSYGDEGSTQTTTTTTTHSLNGISISSSDIREQFGYGTLTLDKAQSKLEWLRDQMLEAFASVEIPAELPGVNRESSRYKSVEIVFNEAAYNAAVAAWQAGGSKGPAPSEDDFMEEVVTYDEELIAEDEGIVGEMNEKISDLREVFLKAEDFLTTVADTWDMEVLTDTFNNFFGGINYNESTGEWEEVEGALDIAAALKEEIAAYNGDYPAGSGIAEAQAMLHEALDSFGSLIYSDESWEEYDEEFYLLCLYVTMKAITIGISIQDIRRDIWNGDESPLEQLYKGEEVNQD